MIEEEAHVLHIIYAYNNNNNTHSTLKTYGNNEMCSYFSSLFQYEKYKIGFLSTFD